jgi:hypothetical protein
MTRTRLLVVGATLLVIAGGAWWLHDPPWVASFTGGMREWTEDPPGTRFRWTNGHATFFVPSDATVVTLPLRAGFPGPDGMPVTVHVSVDDRWLADVSLSDPAEWVRTDLPMPRRLTSRRFRRIDLRVSRTIGPSILGVQTGEVVLR